MLSCSLRRGSRPDSSCPLLPWAMAPPPIDTTRCSRPSTRLGLTMGRPRACPEESAALSTPSSRSPAPLHPSRYVGVRLPAGFRGLADQPRRARAVNRDPSYHRLLAASSAPLPRGRHLAAQALPSSPSTVASSLESPPRAASPRVLYRPASYRPTVATPP